VISQPPRLDGRRRLGDPFVEVKKGAALVSSRPSRDAIP
jgi:hypothetical protein